MKKTMIATAVAAAFALPMAAQADVTVYGKVHNSIMQVNAKGPNAGGTANVITRDQWQVSSHDSRLGFKGSEDLGGGMKAIWQYEQSYDTVGANAGCTGVANATASCNGRNTYVGLSGNFGMFLLGRVDTPYKTAWYAGDADFLDSTPADMNDSGVGGDNIGDVYFDETRASNAIAYFSPDMSGFKLGVAAVPGQNSGVKDGLADSWSLGLMYNTGDLKVGAGMESLYNLAGTVPNGPNEKRWHLTGSYTFNNVSLGASYAHVKDDANINGDKKKSLGLSGQYKFGSNAVGLNYRNADLTKTTVGTNSGEMESWSLFLAHNMSKRTKVYTAYGQNEYNEANNTINDQKTDEFSIGVVHNF